MTPTTPEELEEIRVAAFIAGAIDLGISLPRARFLAACSYNHFSPTTSTVRRFTVPYSDLPLIAEAARLGMTRTQAAQMMGMTYDQIGAFGIHFPIASTYRMAPGMTTASLLAPESETD